MSSNKLKILIVDDEPAIIDVISEEFKYKGHSVWSATSGNDAIEILKSENFDVVVSDYRMPNGNGMTVLQFVNTVNPKPIFFFISGHADLSIDDCLKAGAKDFFSKPFDLDYLVTEVEKISKASVV